MTGKTRDVALPSTLAVTDSADPERLLVHDPKTRGNTYKKLVEGKTVPLDADIFTKQVAIEDALGPTGAYETKQIGFQQQRRKLRHFMVEEIHLKKNGKQQKGKEKRISMDVRR